MMPPRFHTPAGKSRFAPPATMTSPPPAHVPASRPVTPVLRVDDVESAVNKVRVVARIRPPLPSEIQSHGSTACLSFTRDCPEETTLHIKDSCSSREGTYKLDSCYNGDDEISVLFDNEIKHFLPKLFQGQNATVFAYGATGSGKTYTMQGSDGHPGLMTLAMTNILEMVAERPNYRVEVAYYQIYNERILDLLDESNTEQIKVFEDIDGKTYLRGLSQVHVKTLEEFNELFVNGCLRRRVGQTGLNNVSSRSHAALVVSVVNTENALCTGKLNLIDLAGNEDNRKTGNEGNRLVESARINQSLFVLSNVITALNSNNPRVPYRDSKLTRILQDSLGGTSHAIMIACLNRRSYQEANQTLTIAARSRQIPNKTCDKKDEPETHVDMNEKLQAWRESKGKLPSNVPGTAKPLFYTPSRQQVNQMRRMDKDFTKDTPKSRRALVLRQSNCSNGKEDKEPERTQISSSSTSTSNNDMVICVDQNEKVNQLVEVSDQMSSLSVCPVLEKENVSDCFDTQTPSLKAISRTSSPPLSERLYKLRAAFREILQPINDNLLPIVTQSTDIVVKKLNPEITEMNMPHVPLPPKPVFEVDISPIVSIHKELTEVVMPANVSPHKTPTGTLVNNEIDNDCYTSTPLRITPLQQKLTTPLEKLSVKSSGIKNTIAKEYINFLNTASREELLELKGIGEKRAAYILSLREHSPEPIKEIEDLEKIGISKKQAISLFNHTARHILFK